MSEDSGTSDLEDVKYEEEMEEEQEHSSTAVSLKLCSRLSIRHNYRFTYLDEMILSPKIWITSAQHIRCYTVYAETV